MFRTLTQIQLVSEPPIHLPVLSTRLISAICVAVACGSTSLRFTTVIRTLIRCNADGGLSPLAQSEGPLGALQCCVHVRVAALNGLAQLDTRCTRLVATSEHINSDNVVWSAISRGVQPRRPHPRAIPKYRLKGWTPHCFQRAYPQTHSSQTHSRRQTRSGHGPPRSDAEAADEAIEAEDSAEDARVIPVATAAPLRTTSMKSSPATAACCQSRLWYPGGPRASAEMARTVAGTRRRWRRQQRGQRHCPRRRQGWPVLHRRRD